MFIEHLFAGGKFAQIVGEEDESKINIVNLPYTVDDLIVPDEFTPVIQATLAQIRRLSARIDPHAYNTVTVFVDPIDGTREFATGQGDYVTILIGYNDAVGNPAAGIMYRPVASGPVTWWVPAAPPAATAHPAARHCPATRRPPSTAQSPRPSFAMLRPPSQPATPPLGAGITGPCSERPWTLRAAPRTSPYRHGCIGRAHDAGSLSGLH
jgi:3'-phosphoadenosine 5'-phosphosulfate (PAPS) 3'-phosphatase